MRHGQFDDLRQEFVLNDRHCPRHWHNYLFNEVYQANITQFGTGSSYYQPLGEGLRAHLTEDREGNGGPRYVYLIDRDRQAHWSLANPPPTKTQEWSCRIGSGYQIIRSVYQDIAATWHLRVPPGEDRCELWTLSISNQGTTTRRLSVMPYLDMHLTGGSTLMDFVSVIGGHYSASDRAVFGINACASFPPYFKGILASDSPVAAATVSKEEFLGTYGDYSTPRAVCEDVHNDQAGTEWLGASLRHDLELAPGDEVTITCLVGIIDSEDDGRCLIATYLSPGASAATDAALAHIAEQRRGRQHVETGDPQMDRWLNQLLKRQLEMVADWGRVIGRGYRDMLQDCFAHRIIDPSKARQRICETFAKQYPDGRCIRAWRLPNAQLDIQDYADSPSWMAMALTMYLKETGDMALLDEQVPYLDPSDPTQCAGSGTVLEHVLCAQRHLLADRGMHGLCRIRHGDWCDTMNGLGRRGEGVSVMLSMQVAWGCDLLAQLADVLQDPSLAEEMRRGHDELVTAINTKTWDGRWYVRAYDDDGVALGSDQPPTDDGGELRLYLNPQAWSLIAGIADEQRADSAIAAVEEHLETGYGKTLNWPQSTFFKPRIGQTSAQTPGFYENGSVYTHGNCFWIAALAMTGRSDAALEAWRRVLPDTDNKPNTDTEPYVIPNMYIGPAVPRRQQRSLYLSGWRTGSAAWMYLIGIEYLLGAQADYHGLRLTPSLPKAWANARIERHLRGDTYAIRYHGHGSHIERVSLDGQEHDGHLIPYCNDGALHEIEVWLGDT